MATAPSGYYTQLGAVESGNNPLAKNPNSSASGLYQFTKSTWEGLGFSWGDRFNTTTQNSAVQKLTEQNANVLSHSGFSVDSGTLYGAHVLGAGTMTKVLGASNSTDLASIVGGNVIKANPQFAGMTVGGFKDWAASKITGGSIGSVLKNLATGNILGLSQDVANATGKDNPLDATQAEDSDGLTGFFMWVKELFSANTAARLVAVLVGVLLIAVALVYLTGTDKTIVEAAKTVGKAAVVV